MAAKNEHNLLGTHFKLAEKISVTRKTKTTMRQLEIEEWLLNGEELKECEDYIEAQIAKLVPFPVVLRLLCLHSLTNGIKPKRFEFFKREVVQTYGFHTLFTLNNLEKLQMLRPLVKKNNWATVRKQLRLMHPAEKVDFSNPQDINYTYNGYAPLAVRLLELAAKPGWRKLGDLLDQLPGKTFEVYQEPDRTDRYGLSGLSGAGEPPPAASSGSTESARKPITLVFFLGGITHGEISAIRHLSDRESHGRDYLICTTKLINGKTLLESVYEKLDNRLDTSTISRPQ